jgi:hypothetical protein
MLFDADVCSAECGSFDHANFASSRAVSSFSETTQKACTCWICYDDTLGEEFIRPCLCKGAYNACTLVIF